MTAYYNEYDPFAAAWLQQLIGAGHIAPGVVDTRSIEDVTPIDLKGFTQCHFFAGIGVWSHALRKAGWDDTREIWTGSCPCQPFSAAGKGNGFSDERHLWPAFFHLIEQCGPTVVLGEQVASKDGLNWLDLVRADVEGAGGAFGAADLCAAGFGAPHIRQRTFWVAYAQHNDRRPDQSRRGENWGTLNGGSGPFVRLADKRGSGLEGQDPRTMGDECTTLERSFGTSGMADANGGNTSPKRQQCGGEQRQFAQDGGNLVRMCSPTNGHWRDADWLGCRDGKWRPVEPGTFPLVNGATNRVGRLRGYGNAIVAPVAQGFIEAVMECLP